MSAPVWSGREDPPRYSPRSPSYFLIRPDPGQLKGSPPPAGGPSPAFKGSQSPNFSRRRTEISMKMSSAVLRAAALLTCALTFGAAQTSCKGRCGAEYYRGYMCQCDYTCLPYGECCKDYEAQCTTKNSCRGRCGEAFKRGRPCSCDSNCLEFKQCCPDYTSHCDAEEEMSGAAGATAPSKSSSCDSVNSNKHTEPTVPEATEQPLPASEENNADDNMIPLISPTSPLPDDPSDDTFSNILPSDEFTDSGPEGASPAPESTSGYGSADPLDRGPAGPTLEPDALEFSTETVAASAQTEATPPDDEPTRADDSAPTATESAGTTDPISSTNPGTTAPEPTTPAPRTEVSPTASSPELETVGQGTVQPEDGTSPEAQKTEPTEAAAADEPEVTTLALGTPASTATGVTEDSPVLEVTPFATVSASVTHHDSTTVPDATTSSPETGYTENDDDATSGPPPSAQTDLQDASTSVPPAGGATQEDATDGVARQATTAETVKVVAEPTDRPQPTKPAPSKPQDKPDPDTPSVTEPTLVAATSKPETKPVDTAQTLDLDKPGDYQADDSNDTNLCSGRPVGAVTTLRNGTTVVFRGHYFWFLGRNREPGPARGITQVWGVPSPVDTAFTRCNCHGKTYIFKGAQYWRYENDALDSGYPKVVETGFDGLRGQITAALSVPQHRTRRESVYFFKRGGLVQKYSYQFGTRPTCGRRAQLAVHVVHARRARQAVSLLGPAISIRTSWRGFPTTVTAAVSVPTAREPEGYKYYVFSRTKSYNVRMDGEHPVVAAPAADGSPQSNNFIKCPKN